MQNQQFCTGATVADLQAQATTSLSQGFRWYSTMTSNPALDPSTPLVDGETYYATQITNRTNSNQPPCESRDRFAVTVEVNGAITEETQQFCQSLGDGNNFRNPEVQDLCTAGTWYADNTYTDPLDPNTELIDGEDYYMNNPATCEIYIVTAEFAPTPNAGMTTQVSFCQNEDPVDLVTKIRRSTNLPDEPVSTNGTFSPALENNIFDPSQWSVGSHTFKYTVPAVGDCPADDSVITVTVTEAPNAGVPVDEQICSSELEYPGALAARIFCLSRE